MFNKVPEKIKPYLFIIPSGIFLIVFTYYPVVRSLYLSLFQWNMMSPQKIYVGFQNYIEFFNQPLFWRVIKNNVLYIIGTIPVVIILSLICAILINERTKFKELYEAAIFSPTLVPMAAAAMLWVFMYNPDIGLINRFLNLFGYEGLAWINSSRTALVSIMIVMIWKNIGYYTILFLAGLQNISPSLYESARVEGAGWLKRHIYITLPLITPTLLFVFIVNIIQSFRVFDIIHIMTKGGPGNSTNVMVYYIYQNTFKFWDIGKGATLTSMMVIILLITVIFIMKTLSSRIHY